ncbi:hypothetical protein COCVIDRAFT_113991 [Bipolaris victoriae FI3]|uniref:Uncharacterized protein n=1 Tax=Bipolaris victoriae (strain FI3) TaxID=930091 RepID=W7E2V6_BIPV3|nr:hypothetical protein COCVIDRAFT_113991 [Bipolaris victoriae FI3]
MDVDPTDIFTHTLVLEKSNVVHAIQARIGGTQPPFSQNKANRSKGDIRLRPRLEMIASAIFFTTLLISFQMAITVDIGGISDTCVAITALLGRCW